MVWIHHHVGASSVPWQSAIFTYAYTVAVKPHGHTSVGIAGMNKIAGHIEIVAHKGGKGVIGFLVG